MRCHYVGLTPGRREVFKSGETPTRDSHGHRFNAVIGPFRTRRGARFCALYGDGNPHAQTVAQCEVLGRKYRDLQTLRTLDTWSRA